MSLKNLDVTIIEAARKGDRDAMERLLAVSQPDVRRYAMLHCKISDIDDAVQEVLLAIARRLETLNILAAFSSWIFKTVQRECRRLGRVTLRYDPFDEATLEEWIQDKPEGELLNELLNAIDKLPKDYREVILMKDFYQLTNKEISSELSMSLVAVKSRLHRARLAARALLIN
ncbi:RNA polymerase subunit sigma-24 [Gammaproteobacteria bacterium 42_54_T18]|nr:RNA polymerase subunit sigma-24 [Gammaproteobacteria bacterium 42_54_T18]